jgi:DNA-binding response OmpR family regulator
MRILIVEDDKNSADFLYKTLRSHSYDVEVASSYKEAKDILDNNFFSIILLDWNLGDGSGYDLLQELRELDLKTSVIMITSEDDVNAKVDALDAGSDDYITKPYSSVELLARIRAIARRESTTKSSVVQFGKLQLNTISHEFSLGQDLLKLTKAEYDLLELFIQNPNVVLTRYQLSDHIMKDFASMSGSNLVDVHIKNIRKKLGDYNIIQTIRGVGYTLKEE